MYESHFGFTGLPFQLSPDPAFFFDGAGHREARAALSEGLASGARLLVVTGDIGAGKTTLLRSLLDEWGSSTCKVIHIAGAHLDADALSEMLGLALGLAQVNDPDLRRAALLRFLGSATMSHLLVIDEAQHLVGTAFDLLESIVLATPATSARLQVCIAGQPELRALLQAAERRAFRERIQVDVRLGPLIHSRRRPTFSTGFAR